MLQKSFLYVSRPFTLSPKAQGPWIRDSCYHYYAAGFMVSHKQVMNYEQALRLLSLFIVSTGAYLDRSWLHVSSFPCQVLPKTIPLKMVILKILQDSHPKGRLPSSWGAGVSFSTIIMAPHALHGHLLSTLGQRLSVMAFHKPRLDFM